MPAREETAAPTLDQLTDQRFWDSYWDSVRVPAEVTRSDRATLANEILRVVDAHLPRDPELSVLEVGGAPGQYLAYFHRSRGYAAHALDYSLRGCEKLRENMQLLGIPASVYERDFFDEGLELGPFDVVFSLGFIEHFDPFEPAIERHVDLVRSGGWVLVGCPNLRGVNRPLMRATRPTTFAKHNLEAMDLRRWAELERRLGLEVVFRDYVGGFEPATFLPAEPGPGALLTRPLQLLSEALQRLPRLRRVNAPWLSGYALAVYRKP